MVFEKDKVDHDKTVGNYLYKLHNTVCVLKRGKCSFRTDSVSFQGQTVRKEDMLPDPKIIGSFVNLPQPNNRTEKYVLCLQFCE